ncbi:hypothetical protein SAMN02927921_00405 [Sinomicrobium oceani]|uniref:AB hydrolase-1 domain-containing protein n=1 Tax=Sinomicrobium oceani TaxID=1150368 RepID=A0A1K1M608_9FLAO|nr:alpha/beta fold hydrolase [Sinomicrobium oceani]SFW18513.1 hypothetical protein SAMN02927921_00405 [Sinomicrobium oceani]
MKTIVCSVVLLIFSASFSQVVTRDIAVSDVLPGTLFSQGEAHRAAHLIILIAGSGPTDRFGNVPGAKNNSLRFLAEGLAGEQYDVYSYDKRILALAGTGKLREEDLRFDDFIADAREVIRFFRKDYERIAVLGHSEGSLIGMVAARGIADAFVSVAGAGRPIDRILERQLRENVPGSDSVLTQHYLSRLRQGETFIPEGPALYTKMFRESVQPYMISWMNYDPAKEIGKLTVPVLIVNGTEDLQVKTTEAGLLHRACPASELVLVENMNHVLKETEPGNRAANLMTYYNPELPVMDKLLVEIRRFLNTSLH